MDKKEGRWIYQEDEYGQDGWRCDRCGYFVPWYYKYYKDPHFIADYRFCPKCGQYQQMVGHSADDYCSLGERREGDPDDCIKS